MGRQVSTPLLEKTFHRKVQSRKVFLHRDSFETILQKAEEMLQKCYKEYEETYHKVLENRNHTQLGAYYDAHNRYVQQLHATNGMNEEYYNQTLPSLMEELEDIYVSLSESVSTAVCGAAEILKVKSEEQVARYEMIHNTGKNINSKTDMSNFIKTLSIDVKALATTSEFTKHVFVSAQVDSQAVSSVDTPDQPQVLKDEVVLDNLAEIQVPAKPDSLRQEVNSLENQIRQLTEALDSLTRLQQRSLESSLYNKANELEEDISLKKFDLRVAQIHLAAVSKQLELFVGKLNIKLEDLTSARDRKMSSISSPVTGSIKNKWMRAFRSLKAGHGSSNISNGSADSASDRKKQGLAVLPEYQHIFQEYTYKRITACDYCREVLRGHVRQGLKCKLCKMNVHAHCLSKVPKCQPKPKLLRRQKSASEIETKIVTETGDESKQSAMLMVSSSAGPSTATAGVSMNPLETELTGPLSTATSAVGSSQIERRTSSPTSSSTVPTINLETQEVDPIYQLLKQAVDLGGIRRDARDNNSGGVGGSSSSSMSSISRRGRPTNMAVMSSASAHGGSSSSATSRSSMLTVNQPSNRSSTSAPHSPQRHKLSLRMKSLSLDSPESNEHVLRHRHYHHGSSSSGGISANYQETSLYYGGCQNSATYSNHQSPQSPVHNRRLLTTGTAKAPVRMSSVDLPDEAEKSLSSASTSPCPSPKPHRLLPTNLYVVLYNFRGRHQDELDLRAGYKVTVVDTTDPDWWKGKCLGKAGFFPSKYVTKLHPGERPLQVTHNIQVSEGANNHKPTNSTGTKLLRDQIVIQTGEESDGMVRVRTGDKQVSCPLSYLTEV
ncbi:Uncharacterised protein g10840 [Pycnogonum litorale]